MIEYFLFYITSTSLSWIVVWSKIMKPVREKISTKSEGSKIATFFSLMMGCMACSGVWVSVPVYLYIFGMNMDIIIFSLSTITFNVLLNGFIEKSFR